MKRIEFACINLVFIVTGLLVSGCATWLNPQISGSEAYHAGRDMTVVYLLGKDELKEEHIEAVNGVYDAFNEIMDVIETANLDEFKDEVQAKLRDHFEDDKAYALSLHLLNIYWDRLASQVDWEALQADKRIKVLYDFRRGVEEALTEYEFLL